MTGRAVRDRRPGAPFGEACAPILLGRARLRRDRPRCFRWFLAALLACSWSAGAASEAAREAADWISNPAFSRATWGVHVADAATGETVFSSGAQQLLKPASTAKLFTAALALDLLGPQHVVQTRLEWRSDRLRRGVLRGDLVVEGRGDGTFCARMRVAGGQDGSVPLLSPFAEVLRASGIRRVRGDLVLEDGFIEGSGVPTGWTWDDLQFYYGARPTALMVEEGATDLILTAGSRAGQAVSFRLDPPVAGERIETSRVKTVAVGAGSVWSVERDPRTGTLVCLGAVVAGTSVTQSVAVLDPVRWFGERLLSDLKRSGITVRGAVRVESAGPARHDGPAAARWASATVDSLPVAEWVRAMMKPSQNLQAQLLFLQCGAAFARTPGRGTESDGLRALGALLQRAGIDPAEVRLDEGSGLSRSALVTPAAMVRLLSWMDRHPARAEFLEALPVAGVDGTLRSRFRGTPLAGQLKAKTGSIRYVNALAGWFTDADGRRLVFSAMLNAYHPPEGGPSGREALDELIRRLAGLSRQARKGTP